MQTNKIETKTANAVHDVRVNRLIEIYSKYETIMWELKALRKKFIISSSIPSIQSASTPNHASVQPSMHIRAE